MKPYTVLLLRPDYAADEFGKDTCLCHVEAESTQQAQMFAQVDTIKGDNPGETAEMLEEACLYPSDYAVLFMAEGHINDIKEDQL